MSKTKRMKDGDQVVTRRQLHVLLSQWAKAADLAFSVKLTEMEDRLRSEFEEPRGGFTHAEWPQRPPTVPTDSEGAE